MQKNLIVAADDTGTRWFWHSNIATLRTEQRHQTSTAQCRHAISAETSRPWSWTMYLCSGRQPPKCEHASKCRYCYFYLTCDVIGDLEVNPIWFCSTNWQGCQMAFQFWKSAQYLSEARANNSRAFTPFFLTFAGLKGFSNFYQKLFYAGRIIAKLLK